MIHGSLLDLAADAVLIPCDRFGDVNRHWGRFSLPDGQRDTLEHELHDRRVSDKRTCGDQVYRYVDTGSVPEDADERWLADGVAAGVQAVAEDVTAAVPANKRAMPLVAMPLFGVGDGGFDAIRGAALRAVLGAAVDFVGSREIDVAVVCYERADFAAIQMQRDRGNWAELSDELCGEADKLAVAVRESRLVMFLGAGVSIAAGLPGFASMVDALERQLGCAVRDPTRHEPPERVADLVAQHGKDEIRRVATALVARERYSLSHGLTASLRCREVITTNFDQLYERASARPFADRALEVLPWQRTSRGNPWLLKAHGDPARGDIVFDEASYRNFEVELAPVAGVLRAMFTLSREVLFVGYSMSDTNMSRLIDEAAAFHDKNMVSQPRLGVVLDIEACGSAVSTNPTRLGIRSSVDEPIADAARRLEIFLDHLLWWATKDESAWILDKRYAGLLGDDSARAVADQLATVNLPPRGEWRGLRDSFRQHGSRRGG